MINLDKRIDEIMEHYNMKNNQCGEALIGIISELQAELAARDCLLRDIVKDYQGLETAAENNNLIRTAGDARDTITHITTILQHTTTK